MSLQGTPDPRLRATPAFAKQRGESSAWPRRNISAVVVFKFVMVGDAALDGWKRT